MDRLRKKVLVYVTLYSLLFLFLLLSDVLVRASSTVSLATGGGAISADTTGGTYTTLVGPVISEGVTGDIGAGTIILNAPTGFVFDTAAPQPTVLITWLSGGSGAGGNNINNKNNGTVSPVNSITTTQITFSITAVSAASALNSLTYQNIRVRPTAGTPLASGDIVKTGTSVIAGITNSVTNFGTLTEVAGAKTQVAFTTQPSATATTDLDFTVKPVITVKDQFGNTVTSDSSTTITRAAVLATQTCGGTAGTGTLTSVPADTIAVTSGIMNYTAMQYSFGESIKICASSSGLTSALSNVISVSNPIPTTTSISPTDKAAFSSTFTLTVNGSNFVHNSVVRFNGSDRTTTYISPTQLSASIPSSDLTSVGTFDIAVFNPSLGGGISNAQILNVNNPLPVVSSISPESKVAESGEFILTVDGSNFLADSVVRFNGSDRVTVFVNSMQLTATILAADILSDGVFPITVFNSAPGGGISDVVSFTVSATPPLPDTTAPATISDLALSDATIDSIKLTWTAPGDDGNVGAASSYDIRYSTSLIDNSNWASATEVVGEPSPAVAGTVQDTTVTGLSSETVYFFAIKTSDGVPNTAALSNVPSLTTTAIIVIPDVVPTPNNSGVGGSTPSNTIIFSGQAYPASTIDLLRASLKNRLYQIVIPGFMAILTNGAFEIKHTDIPTAEYIYALQIEDKDGRTTNLSFDVDFISRNNFIIKNIFVPPSLGLIKTLLNKNDDLQVVGYGAPQAIIEVDIDGAIQSETVFSDINGYYTLTRSAASLAVGTHYIKVRQIDQAGIKSDFSITKVFKKSLLATSLADFNDDGLVNVTDWSVFLFRWGSDDQNLRATIDLDSNGTIDIVDLSIFLKLLIL